MFLKCWYCALSSRHSRTHRSYINAIGHCRRKTTSYNNILLLKNGVKVLIVKLNSKTPIQCEMCANIFFFFFFKVSRIWVEKWRVGVLTLHLYPPQIFMSVYQLPIILQSNLPMQSPVFKGHLFLSCHRKLHMNRASFKGSPVF